MMTIAIWQFVLYIILAILGGAVVGFFAARKFFKWQLKKNPPINEQLIRTMFRSMGKTPSEKQVRQVMNSINKQNQ